MLVMSIEYINTQRELYISAGIQHLMVLVQQHGKNYLPMK